MPSGVPQNLPLLSLDCQCWMPKKATYFPFQGERILELFIKSYVFDTYPSVIVWYIHLSLLFLCSIVCPTIIHLFGNKKRTGAEMCPAVVSGIITGDVPVSYWPVFFSLSLVTVSEVFAACNESRVWWPRASGFCNRASESCS